MKHAIWNSTILNRLLHLNGAMSFKLFFKFVENMTKDHQIILTKELKKQIKEELDISDCSYDKSIRQLKNANLIEGRSPIFTITDEVQIGEKTKEEDFH